MRRIRQCIRSNAYSRINENFPPQYGAKKHYNPAQKVKPLKTWFQSHSKLLTAKAFDQIHRWEREK